MARQQHACPPHSLHRYLGQATTCLPATQFSQISWQGNNMLAATQFFQRYLGRATTCLPATQFSKISWPGNNMLDRHCLQITWPSNNMIAATQFSQISWPGNNMLATIFSYISKPGNKCYLSYSITALCLKIPTITIILIQI